jgi:uncharacterized coiled-coil protein SlyX
MTPRPGSFTHEDVQDLEKRIVDVEESQTRHRDLIGELHMAVNAAEKRWDTFQVKVDVVVSLIKWAVGMAGAVVLAIIAAILAKVIHP